MKIGFNEATALECKGQSLIADLEACEKYGFDYIEIRFDCIKDYLKEHTLEELADWFKKSVRDIRGYKVENWSDFTDIVKNA